MKLLTMQFSPFSSSSSPNTYIPSICRSPYNRSSVEYRPFLLTEARLASLASGRVLSTFENSGIFFTFSCISASLRVMHKAGQNTFTVSFVNVRIVRIAEDRELRKAGLYILRMLLFFLH
jgi:hypothetical protein